MTWLLVAALFGVLGAAVTYMGLIVHATVGCSVCEQQALLQPVWQLVQASYDPSLWARALRTVDRAFVNEYVKAAAS